MGGSGKDTLRGGQHFDQYFFGPGWGEDTIIDGATYTNGVHFRKAHLENVPVTEDLTIRLTSGAGPEVKSENSTNTIEWEDDTISAVWGGYGDDKFTGNSAANYIDGNRGADTISGGVGGDVVDCGEDIGDTDNDTVYYDVGDQIDSNCETKDAF